jgi:predicted DNA binding CopG/RHH family protein
VSAIKKAVEPQVKRMNLNVPVELHNSFKATTAAQGLNMTDVLLQYIEEYVADHGQVAKKPKGRRQ